MLVVISPAKKLDLDPVEGLAASEPAFQDDATALAKVAGKLSVPELRKLMSISENLAQLNAERFAGFEAVSTADNAKQAAFAFAGDTYQGLEAGSLDTDEVAWAQDHLRILSGLYGVLRPLDKIQPYRLEMGSRLKTQRGKSLYEYWGDTLSKALNEQAENVSTKTLVNCASQEYFGAVDLKALNLRVITPVFMEVKAGEAKIVSFYAKKARGAMARYMITQRLTKPDDLKSFDTGGYRFDTNMSEEDRWVFLREAT